MFLTPKILFGALLLLQMSGCQTEKICEQEDIPTSLDIYSAIHFDTDVDSQPFVGTLCGNNETRRFDNRFSPYKGGSQSVDLIVEHYSFLGCPHCAAFAEYVDELLTNSPEIEQRVRFYFHHYMFIDYEYYHVAAFAASQQGMDKFWQFHDILFATTNVKYSFQTLRDVAAYNLQLDMKQYDAATNPNTIEGAKTYEFLEAEKKIAKANCVYGTPSVYICGEQIYNWRDSEDVILQYLRNQN